MEPIQTESPLKLQKLKLRHPKNFLLSQELIGSLLPKSRSKIPHNRRNFTPATSCAPISNLKNESCDLRIDLLVDFRSLLKDATHWKLNRATLETQNIKKFYVTQKVQKPTQNAQSYRYCSLNEGLQKIDGGKRPNTGRFASQKRNPQNSNLLKDSRESKTRNTARLKSQIIPECLLQQPPLNTVNSGKLQILIPSNLPYKQHLSPSRQTVERSIQQVETENQSQIQIKTEFEKAQLPITLKTKIADSRFQVGYQTLPITGPSEQDISIQCSEGDIMSQMELKADVVQELFGEVQSRNLKSPSLRFPDKQKFHQALKTKIIDPFNLEASQTRIAQRGKNFRSREPLKLARCLHKSIVDLPMSPQQKLENFQTILFSRRLN